MTNPVKRPRLRLDADDNTDRMLVDDSQHIIEPEAGDTVHDTQTSESSGGALDDGFSRQWPDMHPAMVPLFRQSKQVSFSIQT